MRRLSFIALLMLSLVGQGAELWQVTWPSESASPLPKLDANASRLLPAFHLAMATLPEPSIVTLALSQPPLLGLTQAQASTLQPLTAQRYRLMADSDLYAKAPSALPYCFSLKKPDHGLATVYVPDGAKASTPVILFLHGYGGSFLWYQHYLSESFASHIIVCPAYGISSSAIPQQYVSEAMEAVSKRLGFRLATPTLIGLSAGGFGACRLYAPAPQLYARLICLAAYPPNETIAIFPQRALPRFLSGGAEYYVTSGDLHRRVELVRRSCPNVQEATIPQADHFFLLSHQEQALTILRRWLGEVKTSR